MNTMYGKALKQVISSGSEPADAVARMVRLLKHSFRSRDIVPMLQSAQTLFEREQMNASVHVSEAKAHSVTDEEVREWLHSDATTPVIRSLDTTLVSGWVATYRGERIDMSAKQQLHRWYQQARTRI